MPVLIIPADTQPPDELRIRSMNIRTSNGRDRRPDGTLIPDGSIFVAAQLAVYRGGAWMCDLDPVVIQDVEAWIGSLAAAGDPQTAEVAGKFSDVNDGLKWLVAKAASASGQSQPPA